MLASAGDLGGRRSRLLWEDGTMKDDKYGVLLFDNAWEEIGEALKHYQQEGPIGKYLYCREIDLGHSFVTMTFTPHQVEGKIASQMSISIPSSFVKFVAEGADKRPMGFR